MADSAEFTLSGKTVFVSRSREESPELCRVLESRGAQVIAESLLRFAPAEDPLAMDSALTKLGQFDWWLITSRRAVEFAVLRSRSLGRSLKDLAGRVQIGAVGSATASAAQAAGLRVSYSSHEQSAAGLASELALRMAGRRVLLLRSNLSDSSLPQTLAKDGAQVTDVIAYYTLSPDDAAKTRLASLAWETFHATIFFSPSAIRHLVESVGQERMKTIANCLAVAVGPTTGEAARQNGFRRCVQAQEPSLEAIVAALHGGLAALASHKVIGANRA